MAERGAHLTATEQEKPSIFEVVASDSLHATFHPALKRLFNLLATINPVRFGWTSCYYDELFLLINATVQQYYVRRFGGSLSEVFYGLTRSRWNGEKLTARTKALVFAALVILPYVRIKLDTLLERYKDELDTFSAEDNSEATRSRKQTIVRVCSASISVYESLQVIQYVAYMANRSQSHSILLHCMRMSLAFLPPDEGVPDWTWSDLFSLKLRHTTILTSLVFRGLELSAFFLQFVRWWQTEASQGNLMNLPVPAAPQSDANSSKYMGICPICVQSWDIPTALSMSGYVYCFKCIVQHIERTGKCPITNYPADMDDLIRIFEV